MEHEFVGQARRRRVEASIPRDGGRWRSAGWLLLTVALAAAPLGRVAAQETHKPVLHGKHWVAVTGKPLSAEAGAQIFQQGGNAVDAACAMLAAGATMWDVLSWGGETQALIYDPENGRVVGIDALGVAPTGATPKFFHEKGMKYPPAFGPLAAVTPGTPGGLMTMLAEYGTMSLKQVLAPAIEMARNGYAMEAQTANSIEANKDLIKKWKYSRALFLTHPGEEREAPHAGEVFKQPDLAATLQKLVDAEQQALSQGKSRKQAIYAAYDRFYKGDIARQFASAVQEQGGLITTQDLANWKVHIEEPVHTSYKGIEVYKLTSWVQGPVMLQVLNILEHFDLAAMGLNSARYIHTVYQAMNLAYADRDFYYGDPYVPPAEPIQGLLSKDYAAARARLIDQDHNDPDVKPGNPYDYQAGTNPFLDLLSRWHTTGPDTSAADSGSSGSGGALSAGARVLGSGPGAGSASGGIRADGGHAARTGEAARLAAADRLPVDSAFLEAFTRGTTSIEAAGPHGWVISVTPSGGWIPAVVAGHTGVGLSERMQSFVLDSAEDPYNVVQPGQRPRATLTPTLALKDGKPYLAFAVQGGDTQDQNLLQFFLDVVEFGFDVQQAAEAPNFTSYQMRSSFGDHSSRPGHITLNADTPPWVRWRLHRMGYTEEFQVRTSGPITAIFIDRGHGTFWGAASDYGEDYGIAW